MGNYLFTYDTTDEYEGCPYSLIDEEKERNLIDNNVDSEINNKNFWYWGFVDDYITEKMLSNNINDENGKK